MRDSALDAVFILQNADQYYFAGTVQVGILCVAAEGEPLYLVQKSVARARIESPWERVVSLSSMRKAADILAGEGLPRPRRIGLEMDVLPAAYYLRFRELFPDTDFVDASETVRTIRMVKSAFEAGQIRAAARMLEKAFAGVPGWAHLGATELEVAAQIERCLRLQGHQGLTRMRGFNNEIGYGSVSSGPAACHPTFFPGPVGYIGLYPAIPNGASLRRISAGDSLVVDIVGGYGGYIADKTRTYAVGELPEDMRNAHEFVLALNAEIEAMLRPGTECSGIYRRALELVGDSPYAGAFMGAGESQVRFVGHGVGLELDEWPVLASGFDITLQAGMTIAVEPKVFFPARGGVGIENTYLVTGTGFEKLTPFEEQIIPAGIAG